MNNLGIRAGGEKRNISNGGWGLRILVAEDNVMIQELIKLILEHRGCYLFMAANGKDVLEEMKKNPYDLILMDIQMHEMNGFDATEQIRVMEKRTREHIPILALMGIPLEITCQKCINAGMDGYLKKPFNLEELLKAIERFIYTGNP